MAVRRAAGLPTAAKRRRPHNLSEMRRKHRSGRKQGRKRGLDSVELHAPDSVLGKKTKVTYNVLNSLIYRMLFYVNIYGSDKLLTTVRSKFVSTSYYNIIVA